MRSIEEEGVRRRSAEICIYVPTTVALYILNQKRDSLNQIETRYTLRVMVARDDSLIPPAYRLERLRPYGAGEASPVRPIQAPTLPEYDDEDEAESEEAEAELEARTDAGVRDAGVHDAGAAGESGEAEQDHAADDERGRRRRRRRRRRDEPREPRHAASPAGADDEQEVTAADDAGGEEQAEAGRDGDSDSEAERRRRRRGRRGGRLRPRRDEHREDGAATDAEPSGAEPPATERIEIVAAEKSPVAAEAATVSLDPWSARYALETASLAPFAGEPLTGEPVSREPLTGEAGQLEPGAESGRGTERSWNEEAPSGGFPDAETMPTAEAEEGVPFVSDSERELEASDAAEHAAPQSGEPARPTAKLPSRPGPTAGSQRNTAPKPGSAAPRPARPPNPNRAASRMVANSRLQHRSLSIQWPLQQNDELAATEHRPSSRRWSRPMPNPSSPNRFRRRPSRAAEDVLVVTEKPANPRRGWWQRVTRS